MENNRALHEAIRKGDLEKFLNLLHQPGIDVNYNYCYDETPLTASIENGNSRMAKHLIEAGCDVNLINADYYSPLALYLKKVKGKVDVPLVEMLLHKGADPNEKIAFNYSIETPLHDSIRRNNLELTSMLLYYGADVNITNGYDAIPLQKAVNNERNSCAEVLLNYHDDFSNRSSVLHFAVIYESPLVPVLLEKGADVNSLEGDGNCLLVRTEYHTNAKMFKYVWSRINYQLVMNHNGDFLLTYLDYSRFSNTEYLECLYLMLESPIAQDLIDHCLHYTRYWNWKLISILLCKFKSRKISPKERLFAIYTILTAGIKIKINDLRCAIENYGFNEEFKALLYAGDFNGCDCIEQIKYFKQWKEDFYLKGFSSFSFENKQHAEAVNELLATSSRLESETMLEALRKVPKFPTLLELSRNEAQKFIEQKFTLTKLYQFYDAVACLKLPQSMKDVILLEKPIYDEVTIIK